MQNIIETIAAGIMLIAVVFVIAVFGGTIVWLIWPVVGQAFPGLVTSGAINGHLTWWDSVSLTWLFGLLIKSTQTNKKN